MNESFLECMVRYPGQELGDFRTLDMLLMLAGYHDYSVSLNYVITIFI